MGIIDPPRHPFLSMISVGSRWIGTDAFPSCMEWADEHESWMRYVKNQGELDRYIPRLTKSKEQRDEAFSEMAVAYYLGAKCGLSIVTWEPPGEAGKKGEFIVQDGTGQHVFVEVKSPGWEAEIVEVEKEGRGSPRLSQPKHVSGETRFTEPWASVRHAVCKAYPKMPATLPTFLVIRNDLVVDLNDWGPWDTEIALYTPKHPGQSCGYLAETAPFADKSFERLGAVGIFTVDLPASGIQYRLEMFENPYALPSVAIPKAFLPGHQRHTRMK